MEGIMLTPEGKSGSKTDKIMLLSMWFKLLEKETNPSLIPLIAAGMGKPTYPNNSISKTYVDYWQLKAASSQGGVSDYGNPQGAILPRELMAKAMMRWYKFL
jgi:hypothetical protein